MMRPSWLDALVERFQHNWETNPQYRAIVSGVAGLVVIVGLCAVMGVSASFAGAVGNSLAGSGGSGNSFVSQNGSHAQATQPTYPWVTLTPWPAPIIPNASPIGASQTPQPTPTFAPTPTLAPTPTCDPSANNCGGGGGGGGGGGDKITVTISPTTFANGTAIIAYIHTSMPNEGYAISITWPTGGFVPQGIRGQVDGSGNASAPIGKIPGGCPGGTLKLWVVTQNNASGVTAVFNC
jgi:hypothetical protein